MRPSANCTRISERISIDVLIGDHVSLQRPRSRRSPGCFRLAAARAVNPGSAARAQLRANLVVTSRAV